MLNIKLKLYSMTNFSNFSSYRSKKIEEPPSYASSARDGTFACLRGWGWGWRNENRNGKHEPGWMFLLLFVISLLPSFMETTTYVIFGLNPLYIDAQLYKGTTKATKWVSNQALDIVRHIILHAYLSNSSYFIIVSAVAKTSNFMPGQGDALSTNLIHSTGRKMEALEVYLPEEDYSFRSFHCFLVEFMQKLPVKRRLAP